MMKTVIKVINRRDGRRRRLRTTSDGRDDERDGTRPGRASERLIQPERTERTAMKPRTENEQTVIMTAFSRQTVFLQHSPI